MEVEEEDDLSPMTPLALDLIYSPPNYLSMQRYGGGFRRG